MARNLQLVNAETTDVILSELQLANTFWQRFCGWQFRQKVHVNEGLLIAPCRSIHTFFMRFPIDVLALDREGNVLQTAKIVPPWRTFLGPKNTFAIVEAASGALSDTLIGTRISILVDDSRLLPQVIGTWNYPNNP